MIFAYFYPHRVQAYVCLSLRRRCYNIGAKEKYTFKRETTATKAEEKWIFQAKINLHQSTRIDRCRHVWKGQLKYKKKPYESLRVFFSFSVFSLFHFEIWDVGQSLRARSSSSSSLLVSIKRKTKQNKKKRHHPSSPPVFLWIFFFLLVLFLFSSRL